MPEEQQPQNAPAEDNAIPRMDHVNPIAGTGGSGPGGTEAGISGILLLAVYLVVFTLFVIYSMVKIWPQMTPSREPAPGAASPTPNAAPSQTPTPVTTLTPTPTTANSTQPPAHTPTPTPAASATPSPSPSAQPSPVTILGLQFEIWDEQRLLLLVILGGALGTLVHSLRSVYWYVGNRNLVKSWMAMYFMLPFAGAALALVFYLVVRGGFFSPQSSFKETSPFGFAAFSALIGMFSSQAVLKLKEVAEVLLSKPLGGANAQPQGVSNPAAPPGPNNPAAPPAGGNPPVQH